MAESEQHTQETFYCPKCNRAVTNPLVCGDCLAIICRECGTPVERADDLGLG